MMNMMYDSFSNRSSEEKSKRRDGFSFAYSGQEALDFAMQHRAVLILSDINMPGMSGLNCLKG